MDFLTLIGIMFDLQEKFPDMRWHTDDGMLVMSMEIGDDNEKLLADGRKMFEPA